MQTLTKYHKKYIEHCNSVNWITRNRKEEPEMVSLGAFLRDYKVVQTFKETGQKKVFLADHPAFNQVVIKIGKSPSQVSLERSRREVEVQRSITSPFYPKIYDYKTFDNFQFAIIEEYIPAKPLSECLSLFSNPLTALQLLKVLVTGLDLLWEKKTAHRDLKPDNILIRQNSCPVIIDLGIVLALEQTSITAYGCFSPCTPNYAAPEQLKNRRASIDHRTDQFILGIDLMELLGGVHPFDPKFVGCGMSIPENIVGGLWRREILLDARLAPIAPLANRLLASEPYRRFKTSDSLREQIDTCIGEYK